MENLALIQRRPLEQRGPKSSGYRRCGVFSIALILLILLPVSASAMDAIAEAAVPDDLLPGLEHLLSLTGPQSGSDFDPRQIEALMAFVTASYDPTKQYHTANRFNAPSAYIAFDFNKSLAETLKFAYNPDVPGYALNPTSIRWSHWNKVEGSNQSLPRLWEKLPDLDRPYMVKGHEFVEITPDLFANTYYAYGLYRTLILLKHNGNNVLISLSKQDDTSEVGKKGLIVGADDDWNYFYSSKEGTGKAGIGWMRTYMYDSFSVMIYYQMSSNPASVRCSVFKWLRAGWLDINVVKDRHIYKGLERFARTFKQMIESPAMPPPEILQQEFASIEKLSLEELRVKTRTHLAHEVDLIRQAGNQEIGKRLKPFYDDDYINDMTKPQLQSVLVLAYLKNIFNKQ